MSVSLSDNINIFPDQPSPLPDRKILRGQLGMIGPWTPGQILAAIGRYQVILPAEFERKLKKHAGYRIEVMRVGESRTVVRL